MLDLKFVLANLELVEKAVNDKKAANEHIDLKKLPDFKVSPKNLVAIIQDHREHYLGPYKQRLEKLIIICRDRGIMPVLVTQPVLYGDIVDETTGVALGHKFVAKDIDGATAWDILELYNDVTRQVGREQGVPVIDLAREMPKDSRYYFDLMHYTNAGAAKLADLIDAGLTPVLAQRFPQYYRGAAAPRSN